MTRDLPLSDCLQVLNESASERLAAHAIDELNQQEDADKIKTSFCRFHSFRGHPTNQQLMRVLKHGGASSAAIEAAQNFARDHCQAHKTPKIALPAQVQRVVEFNALVGVDIKYVTGWPGNSPR